MIAPIFAADRQPKYLISLHPMKKAVSPDELTSQVDAVLKSARTLTGQAPE